eukprot:424903-Pleurochrysis_carterae.AAC.1
MGTHTLHASCRVPQTLPQAQITLGAHIPYSQRALILNEQARWCELCATAHGKDCQKLREYRMEETKRTTELITKAKREMAPTRAQQQAARPIYTLDVEKEKQVREAW